MTVKDEGMTMSVRRKAKLTVELKHETISRAAEISELNVAHIRERYG